MTTELAPPAPPNPGAAVPRASVLNQTAEILLRELRPLIHNSFSLVFSLLQPLVFLGFFGPLLVATSGAPAAATLEWFVPGVIVMICLFGTGTTGSNLLYEMQTGSHERFLVAPIPRWSLLVGRALKEAVPVAVQALIIVLVSLPFGFSVSPVGLLLGIGLLAVFAVGFGSLSYALGVVSYGSDWMFWGVQQTVLFPLLILSGMLLPLDGGPRWMQIVAWFNPLSYIVDAERALLAGELAAGEVLYGAIAGLLTCLIGVWIGVSAIKRER